MNQDSIDSLYDDLSSVTSDESLDSSSEDITTSHHHNHTILKRKKTQNNNSSLFKGIVPMSRSTKTGVVKTDSTKNTFDTQSGHLLSTHLSPAPRRNMQSSTHLDTTQIDRFYDDTDETYTTQTRRSSQYNNKDEDDTASSESLSLSSSMSDKLLRRSDIGNNKKNRDDNLHSKHKIQTPLVEKKTLKYSSKNVVDVPSGDTVFKVEDTDFDQLFGTELPGSMIVVGAPKQGKTSHLVDLLRRLHPQLDVVYVFTKTVQTRKILSKYLPDACIITELVGNEKDFKSTFGFAATKDVVQSNGFSIIQNRVEHIIETFKRINQSSMQIRGLIAFDDVFLSNSEAKLGLSLMSSCFRAAHRVNLYTITYVHRIKDIYGQVEDMVNRIVFVGDADQIINSTGFSEIRERTKTIPGLKSEEALKNVIRATMRIGTSMVIQSKQGGSKTSVGNDDNSASVSFWSYPSIEDGAPFTVCHPDLYTMLFMHGRATQNVTTDTHGNMSVVQRDIWSKQMKPIVKFATPFGDEDENNGQPKTDSKNGKSSSPGNGGPNKNITTVSISGNKQQNVEPHSIHIVDSRKRKY